MRSVRLISRLKICWIQSNLTIIIPVLLLELNLEQTIPRTTKRRQSIPFNGAFCGERVPLIIIYIYFYKLVLSRPQCRHNLKHPTIEWASGIIQENSANLQRNRAILYRKMLFFKLMIAFVLLWVKLVTYFKNSFTVELLSMHS